MPRISLPITREKPRSGWGITLRDDKGDKLLPKLLEGRKLWCAEDGDGVQALKDTEDRKVFLFEQIAAANLADETYLPPCNVLLDDSSIFFAILMAKKIGDRSIFWPDQFDLNSDLRAVRTAIGKTPVVIAFRFNKDTGSEEVVGMYHLVYKHHWILAGQDAPKNTLDGTAAEAKAKCSEEEKEVGSAGKKQSKKVRPYWFFGELQYKDDSGFDDTSVIVLCVNQKRI